MKSSPSLYTKDCLCFQRITRSGNSSGSAFGSGNHVVTYTGSDDVGNKDTCSIRFKVSGQCTSSINHLQTHIFYLSNTQICRVYIRCIALISAYFFIQYRRTYFYTLVNLV